MIRRIAIGLVLLINIMSVFSLVSPSVVYASTPQDECENVSSGAIEFIPKWYKYLDARYSVEHGCQLDDDANPNTPFNFARAVPKVLLAVFEILMRIVGILTVVFVIYGGFQYLTSTGEPDKAKAARTTIMNALVGMMIAIFATVIVNVVGRNIG